ncbi:hypothetical protein CGCTS75_v007088 [Colletotrichum tropicale]|nr:hypothetical protein CGCTS75_v007088 [Colletotrichum tropicale]
MFVSVNQNSVIVLAQVLQLGLVPGRRHESEIDPRGAAGDETNKTRLCSTDCAFPTRYRILIIPDNRRLAIASGDWPQATTDVEISFFGERGQGAGPSRLTTRYQTKEMRWKATVGKEKIDWAAGRQNAIHIQPFPTDWLCCGTCL